MAADKKTPAAAEKAATKAVNLGAAMAATAATAATAADESAQADALAATQAPAGAAQAEAEQIAPAPGEAFVMTRKGLSKFHRCGMRFTPEPTVLVVADLAPGTLERLRDEPNLIVVEG